MNLSNVERFMVEGYELRGRWRGPGDFQLTVGGLTDGHSYVGASLNQAAKGLNQYLENRYPSPQSTTLPTEPSR